MTDSGRTPRRSYRKVLGEAETESAICELRRFFESRFSQALNLRQVRGPVLVYSDTGINDALDGVMQPVRFRLASDPERSVEIVQSLAKWKRAALAHFGMQPGEGLWVDMLAVRPDEELDAIHSVTVDQWDWEKAIREEQRSVEYLKETVRTIYDVIRQTERRISEKWPQLRASLPKDVAFVHTEDLEERYPNLAPPEREDREAEKEGACFVIGIGHRLRAGVPHGARSPDYDDWSSRTDPAHFGLNGDIIVWHPVLRRAFELSSMGIRVDPSALREQLRLSGLRGRMLLPMNLPDYHRQVLSQTLPQSIGGGIGQSRLCMLLLRKKHIGEVQFSVWPQQLRQACRKMGVQLR
jgi:aspartate--ammonia ligase